MTSHQLAEPVHETAEPGTPMHQLAPAGWYTVECTTCDYYARDVIQARAQERADSHVLVASMPAPVDREAEPAAESPASQPRRCPFCGETRHPDLL